MAKVVTKKDWLLTLKDEAVAQDRKDAASKREFTKKELEVADTMVKSKKGGYYKEADKIFEGYSVQSVSKTIIDPVV